MNKIIYFIAVLFILPGCNNETKKNIRSETGNDSLTVAFPTHFPKLDIPVDNAFTRSRVALGKELFFSSIFSYDGKTSCASCHEPSLAFADTTTIATGVEGRKGIRNTPSLVNVAWSPVFFMDGGVPTLEIQALAPFGEHSEMNFSMSQAVEILNNDKDIVALSKKAYGRNPDAYVFTRALACYQRTLFDGDSKYDLYLADSIKNPLTASEKKGMNLFFSTKTGCADCHSGILFSDYTFQNIGLYEQYADTGRARVTMRSKDSGKFKVPSLRNAAITYPYMHDGSIKLLEDVLRFYETGGKPHKNKSPKMRKFTLTAEERTAMVDFLETLTGKAFIKYQ